MYGSFTHIEDMRVGDLLDAVIAKGSGFLRLKGQAVATEEDRQAFAEANPCQGNGCPEPDGVACRVKTTYVTPAVANISWDEEMNHPVPLSQFEESGDPPFTHMYMIVCEGGMAMMMQETTDMALKALRGLMELPKGQDQAAFEEFLQSQVFPTLESVEDLLSDVFGGEGSGPLDMPEDLGIEDGDFS